MPVESWRQFQAHFGDFIGADFWPMPFAAFSKMAGEVLGRARGLRSRRYRGRIRTRPDGLTRSGALSPVSRFRRIAAFSPGVWGNDLDITMRETHRAQTLSDPAMSAPEYAKVASVSGFARGTHVRLTQGTRPAVWKVVSDVDAAAGRLIWVNGQPEGVCLMIRHSWAWMRTSPSPSRVWNIRSWCANWAASSWSTRVCR